MPAFALLVGLSLAVPAAAVEPSVTPDTVEAVVFPGGEYVVEKTVTTPEIPPKVDVCLLEDETGSFFDDIANLQNPVTIAAIFDGVRAASPDSQFAVAGFRDYPVSPYGSPGDWVYRLYSTMSPLFANWSTGVNLLSAGGGNDIPEAQYDAIVAAVDGGFGFGSCGFRADPQVAKVLVVTTDAPFHGPDGTHVNDGATTITALTAANVTVIGLKAPGAGGELDALAAATGGSVQPLSSNGANIASAILAGLGNLPVEVSMESDCAYPISTTFSPASRTVTSGSVANFTETISVAADAPGGTYICTDYVLIDGERLDGVVETKTIKVPEGFLTGGGQIGKGPRGWNFGGNVGYLADFSIVGQWQFQGTAGSDAVKLHSTSFTSLQFSNNILPPPQPPDANANVADFSGTARVKVNNEAWLEGCTFSAQAQDHGEPGRAKDIYGIRIDCTGVGGGSWTFGRERLDAGNLQIHSGLKS